MSIVQSETGHTSSLANNDAANCDEHERPPQTSTKNKNTQALEYIKLLIDRMYSAGLEICIMLLIMFTYAALTNEAPKISKSPTAYPFFPKGSVVKDFYAGELSYAISKARQSDIAFVMFYAPWDAESQEIRKEFESAARYMHKLITFSAVNCWQPDGECRNQYSKVYSWPVLIAYPTHGRGIQYNGPKTALHMMRFLYAVMDPLKRVTGLDLHFLRQRHDAVVLANINSYPGSMDYSIFYSTALRFLEKDPFQEIAFAVNTQYSLNAPKLSIYTWNATNIYLEEEWKAESLLSWIFKSIQQVSVWASPSGSKSQQLSGYVQPGPALILFTPRNPLFDSNDYYDLLHEVALEYYYCTNQSSNFGTYLLSLGIHNNRIANYKTMSQPCSMTVQSDRVPQNLKQTNVVTVTTSNFWTNDSYCVKPTNKKDRCMEEDITHLLEKKFGVGEKYIKNREEVQKMYENMVKKQSVVDKHHIYNEVLVESYKNVYRTSILTGFDDPRSPRNLLKVRVQNKCRLRNIGEKFNKPYFTDSTINSDFRPEFDVTGLGCKANRSISILAMDSLKYHHFAESLGIDVLNNHHKTAAVIIDEKMETHFVLKGKVNDKTLREFIYKFHEHNVSRALYSGSKVYERTHLYKTMKNCQHDKFCVKELSSENFLSTVLNPNKAVVVLFHTKQCAFCSGLSHRFLSVAKIFSMVSNLEFARIDGELNTLPWEYTMESYPTILFFPSKRKSETRVFSGNTPITMTSLVNFVLSNLSPPLKLHAMWSLCNQSKFEEESQACIASIRIDVLSLIEKTLQEWRNVDLRQRAGILDSLRQLKQLHLLLADASKNVSSIQKLMKRLFLKDVNSNHLSQT